MRNDADRSHCFLPSFLQLVTSRKTIAQYHSQYVDIETNTEHFITTWIPHVSLIAKSMALLYPPILNPRLSLNHQSVFHFYNLVVLRILHKWIHSPCNPFGIGFFFSLSFIFYRLVWVVACKDSLFLFIAEQFSVVWMYYH